MQVSGAGIFMDAGTDIMEAAQYIEGMPVEPVAGAYAFYDEARVLQFVGISQHLQLQFQVRLPAWRRPRGAYGTTRCPVPYFEPILEKRAPV